MPLQPGPQNKTSTTDLGFTQSPEPSPADPQLETEPSPGRRADWLHRSDMGVHEPEAKSF